MTSLFWFLAQQISYGLKVFTQTWVSFNVYGFCPICFSHLWLVCGGGSGRGQPCHAIILLSHDIMFWDHVTGVCGSNALNAWPLVKETSLDSGACILKATVSVEFNISVSVIDSAAPSLLTSISVSSWPCPSLNFGLPCIHTPLVSVNGGSKGYLDVSL